MTRMLYVGLVFQTRTLYSCCYPTKQSAHSAKNQFLSRTLPHVHQQMDTPRTGVMLPAACALIAVIVVNAAMQASANAAPVLKIACVVHGCVTAAVQGPRSAVHAMYTAMTMAFTSSSHPTQASPGVGIGCVRTASKKTPTSILAIIEVFIRG